MDGVEVVSDNLQLVIDGEFGTRQKPHKITNTDSEITWTATTPTDTTLAIEAQVQGTTAIADEAVGTGDGTTKVFYLDHWPADTPTITVNGVAETGFTLGNDRRTIIFDTAPADTHAILASYTAVDDPVDGAVETQILDLDSPAGGTFKLGDGTTWTADIAYDASAVTIETELEGLYGAGNVEVSEWTQVSAKYKREGTRTSLPLSLDSIKDVASSEIKWVSTEPTDTNIKICTAISDSNTVEPGVRVDVLVVAGGGGGGRYGGGGAGGLIYKEKHSVSGDILITVGDGGNGTSTLGNNGSNSSFDDLTAIGGGGGGSRGADDGGDGGCGGGAGAFGSGPGASIQPNEYGYGEDGGGGDVTEDRTGGGGGGSGNVGGNNTQYQAGNGGNGRDYSTQFGTTYGDNGVFAGGGGGGCYDGESYSVGSGGSGGGQDGSKSTNSSHAPANTGGAGGGGGWDGSAGSGSNGGSGIVLVRYKTDGSDGIASATGGTKYTEGDYTVHVFTEDGTFSPTIEGGYTEATSGEAIPGISENDDLTGKYLWVRQTLSTNDMSTTPKLSYLEVFIKGGYDSSFANVQDVESTDADWDDYFARENVEAENDDLVLEEQYALEFDGVDDYVDVNDGVELNEGSFELWARVDDTSDNCPFCQKAGRRAYIFLEGSSIDVGLGSSLNMTVDVDVPTGEWIHWSVVWKDGNWSAYKNGQEIESNRSYDGVPDLRDGIYIGKSGYTNSRYLNGSINEVRVWNKALSQQEIQDNMNNRLEGNEEGLIGYWPMNEGEGTTVYDKSTNNNDGTIYGATWNLLIPADKFQITFASSVGDSGLVADFTELT